MIAEGQHGVVTAQQLAAIGLGRATISERSVRGKLHRLHQGVYAVGHTGLSREAWWMAAVLACGDRAVLSHMSAAALWGLLKPDDGPIDVSIPSHSAAGDGAAWDSGDLGGAHRRGPSAVRVSGAVGGSRSAAGGARGPSTGRSPAAPHAQQPRGRLPRVPSPPSAASAGSQRQSGALGGGLLWRAARLAVETDFYDYHRGATSFEDDHQRDLDLRRLGYRVRRYTEVLG